MGAVIDMMSEEQVRLKPLDRLVCAASVAFAAIAWPAAVIKIVLILAGIWR